MKTIKIDSGHTIKDVSLTVSLQRNIHRLLMFTLFSVLFSHLHMEHLQSLTNEVEELKPNLLPENEMLSVCMPIAHVFYLCGLKIEPICGPKPYEPIESVSQKIFDSSSESYEITHSCTRRLLKEQNRTENLFSLLQCENLKKIQIQYEKTDHHHSHVYDEKVAGKSTGSELRRNETYLNFGLLCISFQLSSLDNQILTLSGMSNKTDLYLYSHSANSYPTESNEFLAVLSAGFDSSRILLITQHFYHPLDPSCIQMFQDWLLSWLPNRPINFDRLCAQRCEKRLQLVKPRQISLQTQTQQQQEPIFNYLYTFLYQHHSRVPVSSITKHFSDQCVRSCRIRSQVQQVFNTKHKYYSENEIKIKLHWIRRLELFQQRSLNTLEYFLYFWVLIGSVYGWWPVRLIRRFTASSEEIAANMPKNEDTKMSEWARKESSISDLAMSRNRSKASSRANSQIDDGRWIQCGSDRTGDDVSNRNLIQSFNGDTLLDARRLPVRAHSTRKTSQLTSIDSIESDMIGVGAGASVGWSNALATVHPLSDRRMKNGDNFWISPTDRSNVASAKNLLSNQVNKWHSGTEDSQNGERLASRSPKWEHTWRQGLHRLRFMIRLLLLAAGGLFWLKLYFDRNEHNHVHFIMESHDFMLSRFTLHTCFRFEDISLNDPNQDFGSENNVFVPNNQNNSNIYSKDAKPNYFIHNRTNKETENEKVPKHQLNPNSVKEDNQNALTNRTFGEMMVNTRRLDQLLDGVMTDNYVVASFYNPSYVRHQSLTYLLDGLKCFALQVNLPELLVDLHSELNRFVFRRRYQIVFNFARKVNHYQLFAYKQKRRQAQRYTRMTTDFKAVQVHDLKGTQCADYSQQTFIVGNQQCHSYDDCYNRCVLQEHLTKYRAHCKNCWVPEQYDSEGRLHNSELGFVERDDEILHSKCARMFPIDCERFDFYEYETRSERLDRVIQLSLQMPNATHFIFEPVSRLLFLLQFICLLQAIALDGIYSTGKLLKLLRSSGQRVFRWLFGANKSTEPKTTVSTNATKSALVRQKSFLQRFPSWQNGAGASTNLRSSLANKMCSSRSKIMLGSKQKMIDNQSIEYENGFRWLFSWHWFMCLILFAGGVSIFLMGLRSVHQRIRVSHTYELMHLQPRNEHLPAIFVCIPFADETPVKKLEDDVLYEVDRLNGFSIKQLKQKNHTLSNQFKSIYYALNERDGVLLSNKQMDLLWNDGRLDNLQFSFVYYRLRICFGFRVHLQLDSEGWRSVPEEPRRPLIAFRLRHKTPADLYIGPDLENLLSHTIHQTLHYDTQFDYVTQLIVRSGRYEHCKRADFGANHRLIIRSIKQSFAQHHFTTNHLPIEQPEYQYTINNFDFLKDVAQFDLLYRRLVKPESCEKRFKLRQASRSLSEYNIIVMAPRSVEVLLLHSNRALGLIFIHLLAFVYFLTQAGLAELLERQAKGEQVWRANYL